MESAADTKKAYQVTKGQAASILIVMTVLYLNQLRGQVHPVGGAAADQGIA